MRLFSEFPRTDASFLQAGESAFEFLDRSSWSATEDVRARLEDWFSDLPESGRGRFRSGIQARDPRKHEAAFLELATHALLRKLGLLVEVEPTVAGTTPDFRLQESGMLVESTVFDPIGSPARDSKLESDVLTTILDLESPEHWIEAEFQGDGKATPALSRVRREVEDWLRTLIADLPDDDKVSVQLEPEWALELHAMRKSLEIRGKPDHRFVSSGPTKGWWGDGGSSKRLASSLRAKARKYRHTGARLIIVVNCLDAAANRSTWENALFGDRGLWGAGEIVRHQNVASVLAFNSLRPWSTTQEADWLYTPRHREQGPLDRLASRRGPELREFEGKQPRGLLGFPEQITREVRSTSGQ
ncbi:MAG: hypothetical protein M0R73_05420 [Dehalococcoidia bacterium]|nr:hypothetical protein [Dehalococcoidia bacterium]